MVERVVRQGRECGVEGVFDDLIDQEWRCVETARASALVVGHEAFERAAEHFRIDCGFGPCRRVFVGREAVAIEQFADEGGECIIGKLELMPLAFERGWREQSAIEKRDVTEGECGGCALGDRSVERTEEERAEELRVQCALLFENGCCVIKQEVTIVVEPPFRLEEREEEAAGRAEQREFDAFGTRGGTGGRRCERGDGLLERVIKSCRKCIAFEDVAEARVSKRVIQFGNGGQGAQCVGIGIDDVCAVEPQHGDSRSGGMWRDRGECDCVTGPIAREDAPPSRRGIARECGAQSPDQFAGVRGGCRAGVWCERCGEQAQRAMSSRDVGRLDKIVDADRAERVG